MSGAPVSPLLHDLRTILERDLRGLQREVAAYPSDAAPWQLLPGLTNCGGTLVLHLVGNLRHYIGAVLGGTGYVRDRAREFAARDITREVLHADIETAIRDVEATLSTLDPSVLERPFPEAVGGVQPVTRRFLLHLAVHLTYHLGQVDAHRRAVSGDASAVGNLALTPLID